MGNVTEAPPLAMRNQKKARTTIYFRPREISSFEHDHVNHVIIEAKQALQKHYESLKLMELHKGFQSKACAARVTSFLEE